MGELYSLEEAKYCVSTIVELVGLEKMYEVLNSDNPRIILEKTCDFLYEVYRVEKWKRMFQCFFKFPDYKF